jgi:hypothetical protein
MIRIFIFQLTTRGYSHHVTSSVTRGWVCHLQLLLVLASAVILRSESRRIHDHILLSQIRDSTNLECQVPVFISPRNRVARLYAQALGSLLVSDYLAQIVPVITSRHGITEITALLLLCLDSLPQRCVYYTVPLLLYQPCLRVCCCGNSLPSRCLSCIFAYLAVVA